jgi:glycosyltransferase involved in cell wall biosynthesis
MNLLLIPANYPCPALPHVGAQNERCACILQRFVDRLVVVSPRPFIPSLMALRPRWQSYASIPAYYVSRDIEVYRPAYLVVPGLMQALWPNEIACYALRPLVRKLHHKYRFSAILSFDLYSVGGLAWRLGRDLGIPAAGWATGSDIRHSRQSPSGRKVAQTLQKLELVFYQSSELFQIGAQILAETPERLQQCGSHQLLPRGVIGPASPPDHGVRAAIRKTLHIAREEVMVLYLGRIVSDKGLFGLVDVIARRNGEVDHLKLVLVGAQPAFDHTKELEKYLAQYPALAERVYVLPACAPEEIWQYYRAADIFAFPSFKEGMPNSLLEAMLSGLPAVAFDIPAVRDIVRYDNKALLVVKAFNYEQFFQGLVLLSHHLHLRKAMAARGKQLVEQNFSLDHNMKSAAMHLQTMVSLHKNFSCAEK